MKREDSQEKNSWTTADSLRKSPIIPDSSCLDRMERERQEYLEGRGHMLREMNSKYEKTQEVILRRIRSSIQDHDHPSTHNALHHQSTRRLYRSNDICLEPQMKRGGLGHILLRPLRETKACSSMKSLSGSDVDPPYLKPFPPSDEPRKRERPYRRVRGLKMTVEQDCSPFRPEDPSPELCTPEPPAVAKPSRLPRPRNLHMLSKKGNKAYIAPGSKIPRWRGLVRQSKIPEEADTVLRIPVAPPAAAKPSRLPRPKSLHMLAKLGKKVYIAPGSKIPRWRGLVRQSKRPEEVHIVLQIPVAPPAAAKPSRLPRPKSLHMLAKLGKKAYIAHGSKIPRLRGLVRQRRNSGGHVEPVDTRAAPKAVDVSQGRAETLDTPALISEQPLKNPELALRQTVKLPQDEEWERKIEGLKLVSALAEHHAEVLAVEEDCYPFRPEDPSPEVCEGVEDMQDHLHDQAELAAWIARSMGRIVHSTEVKNRTPMEVHSPVDSCTPEELCALPFLYTPVPPPAADKPRRLSRPKSLLMGAKDWTKASYTPGKQGEEDRGAETGECSGRAPR
ncbi:hypothetical protein MHYP_G00300040 [Metynnis hypsauchen]